MKAVFLDKKTKASIDLPTYLLFHWDFDFWEHQRLSKHAATLRFAISILVSLLRVFTLPSIESLSAVIWLIWSLICTSKTPSLRILITTYCGLIWNDSLEWWMTGGLTVSKEVSLSIISMQIALAIRFWVIVVSPDFLVKSSIYSIAFSSLTLDILLFGEGSSFKSSSLRV